MRSNQDELILARFEEALSQAAMSSSTIVNYLADLRAFLRWGKHEVAREFSLLKANQEHVRLYRQYLIKEMTRAASTVNRHLMALRKFFTFAREIGSVATDPTLGVSLVRSRKQFGGRVLSKDEIAKLLEAAHQGSRAGLVRRDVAVIQLLIHTGLRVSEAVDLQKDDLIFDDPGVHLQVGAPQDQSQARQLPISGEVCKLINEYLQVRPPGSGTPHLFLNQEGRPISTRTVQRIIRNCAKLAGLEDVSAQALRRTFAVNLIEKTHDVALVSKRLGHQSQTITEQYLAMCKHQ